MHTIYGPPVNLQIYLLQSFITFRSYLIIIPASEASCGIGVKGVANSVVSPLSPPRGLHWYKFKASGQVRVDAQNVLQ